MMKPAQQLAVAITALAVATLAPAFDKLKAEDFPPLDISSYAGDVVKTQNCTKAGINSPTESEVVKSYAPRLASELKNKANRAYLEKEIRFHREHGPTGRGELLKGCAMLFAELEERNWTKEGLPEPSEANGKDALDRKDFISAGKIGHALRSKGRFKEGHLLLGNAYLGRVTENDLFPYVAEHWFITANSNGDPSAQYFVGLIRANHLHDAQEAYKWLYALSLDGRASAAQRGFAREFGDEVGTRLSFSERAEIRSWVEAYWDPKSRK